MSAVETPPAPAGRRCPRCGAGLTEQQEWCLHCGTAVGARVVAAPGWRAPIALAGLLLALTAIAVALAIVTLADDTEQVPAGTSAAVSPAPTATAVPTPTPDPAATATPAPAETPTPTPSATPDTGTAGGVETWPDGEAGWTIILASERSRANATTKAQGFTDSGIAGVGMLDTDDFSSLTGGYWAVYAGRYDSRSAAEDALQGVDAADAYVRQVTPR